MHRAQAWDAAAEAVEKAVRDLGGEDGEGGVQIMASLGVQARLRAGLAAALGDVTYTEPPSLNGYSSTDVVRIRAHGKHAYTYAAPAELGPEQAELYQTLRRDGSSRIQAWKLAASVMPKGR